MSEENNKSESSIEKSAVAKPKKAKPKKASKPKEKKASKPKEKKERKPRGFGDLPRGYDSEDSTKAVEKATLVLRKRFPTMKPAQWARYLEQVGAGRFLALAKYNG